MTLVGCYRKKNQHLTGVRQQRAKSTVPVSPLSPSTKTLAVIVKQTQ